jgi:uncharacterized protein (DUF2236 family)
LGIKERITARVVNLFSHSEQPLEKTSQYQGDSGLFGPESISWEVLGDVSSFIGGIRALMIQAAHPEVAAGVSDHSRYREDPLGRLSRTAYYVTSMTYGATLEINHAVQMVKNAHSGVSGVSERGLTYSATAPEYSAWVHNTLTDSFLQAFHDFRRPITDQEADRFVREQAVIGKRMGAEPLPETSEALRTWIVKHPAIAESEAMKEAIAFLKKPPLSRIELIGYRILQQAAASTIDPEIQKILGLKTSYSSLIVGKGLIKNLRWALKFSPAWKAALLRSGAEFDHTLFRNDA